MAKIFVLCFTLCFSYTSIVFCQILSEEENRKLDEITACYREAERALLSQDLKTDISRFFTPKPPAEVIQIFVEIVHKQKDKSPVKLLAAFFYGRLVLPMASEARNRTPYSKDDNWKTYTTKAEQKFQERIQKVIHLLEECLAGLNLPDDSYLKILYHLELIRYLSYIRASIFATEQPATLTDTLPLCDRLIHSPLFQPNRSFESPSLSLHELWPSDRRIKEDIIKEVASQLEMQKGKELYGGSAGNGLSYEQRPKRSEIRKKLFYDRYPAEQFPHLQAYEYLFGY